MASSSPQKPEDHSLYARATRAKARWLKRVMYHPVATPMQKCLAYAIADHLNCVTLDSWPAQPTLARLLGRVCIKTVRRAAAGLEELRLITVRLDARSKSQQRYAPVFVEGDMDRIVPEDGQTCPPVPDTNVPQSSLEIYLESASTGGSSNYRLSQRKMKLFFARGRRGALEVKVADLLGADGAEVLSRLAAIDDAIIDRMCQAYADGALSERDLMSAQLAAEQAR